MTLFTHPDLLRVIAQDRRTHLERQARESRLRRDFKKRNRHR
jgi:hypothetical protein